MQSPDKLSRVLSQLDIVTKELLNLRLEVSSLRSEVSELRGSQSPSPPVQLVGRDVSSLAEAVERATPFSVIELPEGEYQSDQSLWICKPMTIRKSESASKHKTVLLMGLSIKAPGVKIESLCIRQGYDNVTLLTVSTEQAFGFYDLPKIEIYDCDLSVGMLVLSNEAVIVRHCRFHHIFGCAALALGENSDAIVDSCIFKSLGGQPAFEISEHATGRFSKNLIDMRGGSGCVFYKDEVGCCVVEHTNQIVEGANVPEASRYPSYSRHWSTQLGNYSGGSGHVFLDE